MLYFFRSVGKKGDMFCPRVPVAKYSLVLARNMERISFSLFLLVLIISISTHLCLFILLPKRRKTEIIQNIDRYNVNQYKENNIKKKYKKKKNINMCFFV
jgi:hypothetical protein